MIESATSVMYQASPYSGTTPGSEARWRWHAVLTILRRYEDTGEIQPQLPSDIQRPGALVGLTLGLLARQASVIGERIRRYGGWTRPHVTGDGSDLYRGVTTI